MKLQRWREIERLYHAALGRPESERRAFLEETCGGDETLRRQVESLLAGETEAENFLESPAAAIAAQALAGGPVPLGRPNQDNLGLTGRRILVSAVDPKGESGQAATLRRTQQEQHSKGRTEDSRRAL